MSIEQQFTKFNIENFRNEFKGVLTKYISTEYLLEHVHSYEEGEGDKEYNTAQEKKLQMEIDTLINQMVRLALESLKLTDNKQEILDSISETFYDSYKDYYKSNIDESELNWEEKYYFKKLVLELLKTSTRK